MAELEQALIRALKEIEDLKARVSKLEQAQQSDQSPFWHMAFKRLANQDMIRGLFHTEILRSAGLLEKAPIADIENKAKEVYVADPGYTLEPRLADLNLQAVMSEIRGEYRDADDFNPKLEKRD